MYPAPPKTPEDVKAIKQAVYTNEGVHGFYVSRDNTAALITAGFWEEGVDFRNLYDRMMRIRQEVEKDGNHKVYIAGFPMLYSWIFNYKNYIYAVIGASILVIILLLWFYFRTAVGVFVPLGSGLLSSWWALGFAGYFGFNLDPLVLVIFVLITARALSHSVQSMERYHEEYHRLGNQRDAIMASYVGLFSPALVAIATRCVCHSDPGRRTDSGHSEDCLRHLFLGLDHCHQCGHVASDRPLLSATAAG